MLNRTVLVTGGAKRLGATIARAVAAAGWRVVVHYGTSADEAQALAAELGGASVQGDLADTAGAGALFRRAREAAGAINAVTPAILAAALAAQDDLDAGAVVNLLDQKLANPNPDFFSYSLSKYALAGATEMLAQALSPKVRVNAVAPGITLPSGDQSEAEFADVASDNLLRRPIGAENVAAAVIYLLGADSVTGQTLFVDAGQRYVKRGGDVMFEGRDG
jgi:NAD(P)-dependent dehydrogenase (short-subunit alcohol dehydrogenase family)